MYILIILDGNVPPAQRELAFYGLQNARCIADWKLIVTGAPDAQIPAELSGRTILLPALADALAAGRADEQAAAVCLLGGDVLVFDGWLDMLLAANAGAAVPVFNRAPTVQQVPCDLFLRTNRFSARKAAAFAAQRSEWFAAQPPAPIQEVSPACLLVRKEHLDALPDVLLEEEAIASADLGCRLAGATVCVRSCYLHRWPPQPGFVPLDEQQFRLHRARRAFAAQYGPWQPKAGEALRSLAMDMRWMERTPDARWNELCQNSLAAAAGTADQLSAAAVRADWEKQDGIYPEVPARLLVSQLGKKVRRSLESRPPMRQILFRRRLRRPPGYEQLLADIARRRAAGQRVVAILAPLFSDHTFSQEDGYIRRVKAVDEDILGECYKVYLYEPMVHLPEVLRVLQADNTRAYVQYDPAVPEQRQQVVALAAACGLTYTHSILRLMPHCWRTMPDAWPNIFAAPGTVHILDLHGAVPEEFALAGQQQEAVYARMIEERCTQAAQVIVAVNHATIQHLKNRYSNLKAKLVCMPIFNEDVSASAPAAEKPLEQGRPVVLYAGGVQPWQKVERMQQLMAARLEDAVYKMFLPDPDAFMALWGDGPLPSALVLDCKAPAELPAEYRTAHYGFVLRDDITVNNVACPTKLVEYLQYGILPILHTPHIGDFAARGMQYITDEDYLAGNLPQEPVRAQMARENQRVLAALLQDHQSGRRALAALVQQLTSR